MAIEYTLTITEPSRHLVEIEIRIPAPTSPTVLVMPSWTPGSYLIREFPRNVQDFSAHDSTGQPLASRKIDKNSWQIDGAPVGPINVRYRVYANELSVRTSHVDASHAYINGASVYMFVRGREEERVRLQVKAPERWRTATSLYEEEDGGFGADDYDMLVDCPIEIGTHRTIGWEQHGLLHRYVLWGADEVDDDRLVADTRKVIDVCAGMFGGLPYDNYLFILHTARDARGGLEHKSSSSLLVTPASLSGEEYEKLISLVAHEFFHVWLGKRIRPEPLGPFDYVAENYTRNLWVVEGFTTYYTEIILLRAGLITPERFLERIGGMIAQYQMLPGRRHQSLEESSFDAWIKFYRPDAHSPNAQVSYYQKGALIALILDLEIRRHSSGARSLDDVVKLLWERYGVRDVGFPEDPQLGIQAIVEEVAGAEMSEIFADYVAGTEEVDFDRFLGAAGLELREISDGTPRRSGSPGTPPGAHETRLGVRLREEGGRLWVTAVFEGMPGAGSGVNSGDEIVGVNGRRASLADMGRILGGLSGGDDLTLTLMRRDSLIIATVPAGPVLSWKSRIERRDDQSTEEQMLRTTWLGG